MWARIAEEKGFQGVWGSSLGLSTLMGVRDANELSWTEVADMMGRVADSVRIPVLVDGDSGHGHSKIASQFVRRLNQRRIAGVCLEDRTFPKRNALIKPADGDREALADAAEFCDMLQECRESLQQDDPGNHFQIVARTDALPAGWGLPECIRRARAYRDAGADALIIHSTERTSDEVEAFLEEWVKEGEGGRREPVPIVLIPTTYAENESTDITRLFDMGASCIIWANYMLRSDIKAQQSTAEAIHASQSVRRCEKDGSMAPLSEVFRLQREQMLQDAQRGDGCARRYSL
ncbi:unnamed protein product [Vitrella brassicaformis CCMP3155]|uniref:Phosphoenolpyruvate phosphomutase n=2 Tax=Vitrella brassicaformis TaxID=1169539 RepID=A0A0G4FHA6_VITBC|nr:unnamed protein product [Vitrella brassicaformis CCMP3155]|eukprot:CEM12677.1 unnamed protein product [Vitrella brassicaformis CCMP3155]